MNHYHPPAASGRILSLDVFRGIVMAAMILVENPGSRAAYHQLHHAAQGAPLTFTDFIFPAFLFAAGMSVYLVVTRARLKGVPPSALLRKAMRRALTLYAAGVLLYLFPLFDLSEIQWHGVLQRIALVFAACTLLTLYVKDRWHVFLFICILTGYWVLLKFVPVPVAGSWHAPDMIHNLATELDRRVYGRPVAEGLLSTVPSIATGLLGMIAMKRLMRPERSLRFFFIGGLLLAAAGLLWGAFFDPPVDGWLSVITFSIQKDLWTSSYVLYTGGACLLFFGLLYLLTEVGQYVRWTPPFLAFGLNSLLAYILSHMLGSMLYTVHINDSTSLHSYIMQQLSASGLSPSAASLAFSLSILLFWWIVLWWLYKKRRFLKI